MAALTRYADDRARYDTTYIRGAVAAGSGVRAPLRSRFWLVFFFLLLFLTSRGPSAGSVSVSTALREVTSVSTH